MNQKFKKILSVFLACAMTMAFVPQDRLAPNMASALAAPSFSDVAGHPSESAIVRWAQLGVVQGSSGKAFPDRSATRVEFLAAMNRVLDVAVTSRSQVFNDVSKSDWYYEDVQKAYAAGLTIGVGNNMFGTGQLLNREMMVTLMGRIFGLYSENTSILAGMYADETTATYGRGHLAAFAEMGVSMAVDGNFEPRRVVTRAEMFQFINDFLPNVFTGSDMLSGRTITGNVLIRTPGITVDNMTLNGSLILGDGVQSGNITLRNCVINGRLIVRGGGPNSVNLTGTTVKDGVYVYNANCNTRIYNTNVQSKIGEVTAMTGVILEGPGFSTLRIPLDAVNNSGYVLRDVTLDSLNVEKPETSVSFESGLIDNVRFAPTAYSGSLRIEEEAHANYVELGGDDIEVDGEGSIDYLVITGDNAEVSIDPRFVSVAPGLSATVDGEVIKGSEAENSSKGTINNVVRDTPELGVKRDVGNTGGTSLTLATANVSNGNQVTITPDATAVQMTDQTRLGYWLGFLVPVPPKAQDPAVKYGYRFEGAEDFVYSISSVSQNSIKGILVYIPVKAKADLTGSIDTTIDITWGNGLYERLTFKGDNFKLAQPTSAQVTRMVNQFGNASFPAYNKLVTYSGSEALKRLLIADNPIGLDTRSFSSFTDEDKNSFASQMYTDRASLTSKPAIQAYLNGKITSVGALYSVNSVMTAADLQKVFEDDVFAGQLGISTLKGSDYDGLSAYGKLNVANALIVARNALAGGKFANEEAVATEFDKAVAAKRKAEIALLTTLNNTADITAMQKLYETKANADLIGIVTASDPYKSLAAPQKTFVATKVVAGRPFSNLDGVRKIFEEMVGTPDKPVVLPPEENPNISGVVAEPATINLVVGRSQSITPTINTTSGSYSTLSSVTFSGYNSAIVNVDSEGTVRAIKEGKTAVKVVSKVDTKKNASVAVVVAKPVEITALEISPQTAYVNVDSKVQLTLKVTPATGNNEIYWSCDDTDIATISNGVVTGKKPGYTKVTAYTEGMKVITSCTVFVSTSTNSVVIDKPREGYIEIGLDGIAKLNATVSPITQSNKTIWWGSSDSSTVSVGSDGTVVGLKIGRATITAESAATGAKDEIDVVVSKDRYGVVISNKSIDMYKNGVFELSATVQPGNRKPKDGELMWNVDGGRTDIVTVDQKTGLVTAIGPGTAVVTVSHNSDPKAYDSCTIKVSATELKVTITPTPNDKKPESILAGSSLQITAKFSPETPSNPIIDYNSTDPEIASVGAHDGKVVGHKKGTVIINIRPQANNALIQLVVNVTEIPLTSIGIPRTLDVLLNSYTEITASYAPNDATTPKLRWYSKAAGIVDVTYDDKTSTSAMIFARASTYSTYTSYRTEPNPKYDPRETVYYGTDASGTSISTPNSLYDPVQNIQITEILEKNTPVEVVVESMDGKFTATCLVTVGKTSGMGEVKTVEMRLDQWVYAVGDSQQLMVDFNGGDPLNQPTNQKVSWSSTRRGVAEVDKSGNLFCYSPGVTEIRVTSADGSKFNTKTIIVAPIGVERIDFANLDGKTQYGKWIQMTPEYGLNNKKVTTSAYPSTATYPEIALTSSNDSVVRVDEFGNLTAVRPGVAVITASVNKIKADGSATPEDLKYNDKDSKGNDYNDDNQIKRVASGTGYAYYGPNKDVNGNDVPLINNQSYPLVVERPIVNRYTVWVTPVVFSNISLRPMPAMYQETPVTVTATITPTDAKVDRIEWVVTDQVGRTITGVQNPPATAASLVKADGTTTFTFTPPLGTTSVDVTCNAIVNDLEQSTAPSTATSIEDPLYKAWEESTFKSVILYGNGKGTSQTATAAVQSVSVSSITGFTIDNKNAETVSLYAGGTYTLTPAISPSNASDKRVSWSSSNTNVIEITTSTNIGGVFTAKATGTSVITATTVATADGLPITRSITLTVSEAAAQGAKAPIAPAPIAPVQASIPKATPTPSPTPAPIAAQTAEVILGEDDIPIAPTYLRIRSSAKVLIGKTIKLYPNLKPLDANQLVWKSEDPSIATVNEDGVITGVSAGRVTVTLESKDGKLKSKCSVQVPKNNPSPSTNFRLSRTNLTLSSGQDIILDKFFSPKDTSMKGVSWYSSNPEVATVDVNGKIVGVSGGVCTITAVSDEGKIARCTVTVKVKVTSLKVDKKTLAMKVGGTHKLNAAVLPEDATTNVVTWKSSNNNIATVSADGTVKAHQRGEVTITATCDGKKSVCTVTVVD